MTIMKWEKTIITGDNKPSIQIAREIHSFTEREEDEETFNTWIILSFSWELWSYNRLNDILKAITKCLKKMWNTLWKDSLKLRW